MLKKIIISSFIAASVFIISSCQPNLPNNSDHNTYLGSFNQFTIQQLPNDEYTLEDHLIVINSIFRDYHRLTNAFEPFLGINNVYTINHSNGQWVIVDERLFDIIYFAWSIQDTINSINLGFEFSFNILLGELTMMWTNWVSFRPNANYIWPHYLHAPIQRARNSYLEFDEDNHRIRIVGGAHLDLGSVTKGYVTQLVYQYLRGQNIEYFLINSGTSSLHMGKNQNRTPNDWWVGITGISFGSLIRLGLQNIAVSTSGAQTQRRTFQGRTYSHIINPITGSALIGEIGSISIITDNSHISDILSTAFFHLTLEQIKKAYPIIAQELGIEMMLIISCTNPQDNQILYKSSGVKDYVVS